MASTKTFVLANDMTVEKLGLHLVTWFQTQKGMVSEGGPAQGGGYFVQAKDQDDGWKKLSGMTKAIQVQFLPAGENVVVICDFGKWSDKVGAGTLGMFVFAPLAVTAGIGAYWQTKLPDEIFAEVERYIVLGGKEVVVTAGARMNQDQIDCPNCGKILPKGQKFCPECGTKLMKQCSNCGTDVLPDARFCPECGTPIGE